MDMAVMRANQFQRLTLIEREARMAREALAIEDEALHVAEKSKTQIVPADAGTLHDLRRLNGKPAAILSEAEAGARQAYARARRQARQSIAAVIHSAAALQGLMAGDAAGEDETPQDPT